jgi:simple sugar transport system permease protein
MTTHTQLTRFRKLLRFRLPSASILPLAILLGLFCGGVLIALSGFSPLQAYAALLRGAFGNKSFFTEVLVKMTPLLLAGLGLSVSSRVQMFSIGAEGQIYLGAMGAAFVGLYLGPLPAAVAIPLAILVGSALGAVWGGIAGWLKIKLNANEIIVTLMMNYIAIEFVRFLVSGPWRDPTTVEPFSAQVTPGAWLPILIPRTRLHLGLILAIGMVFVIWWMLRHTVLGYRFIVTGANAAAAEASGINVGSTILISMLISGGLAGLAGVCELLGVHHRLLEDVSPGYGYTAIIISILGRGSPWGVLLASFLFAVLSVGADGMRRTMGIPVAVAIIIQALVLLFALGSQILERRLALREQIGDH